MSAKHAIMCAKDATMCAKAATKDATMCAKAATLWIWARRFQYLLVICSREQISTGFQTPPRYLTISHDPWTMKTETPVREPRARAP